ncbi:PEP/pyruvate-binding domain-containing protein (plasmid) [Pseudoalteromonas espejiana]
MKKCKPYKQAVIIEKHYGRPMDIEWAKDGNDGKLYIVQASRNRALKRRRANVMERFQLNGTSNVTLNAIGHKQIGSGVVRVLDSIKEMDQVQ